MGALLGLMAAVAYGTSDFGAGVASRRFAPGPVAAVAQACGLLTAALALLLFPGAGPTATVLGWGAISGLGSTLGTLSLYRGLSVGRMSVVATLSAVLTAVIPAVVGLASGDHLSIRAEVGIAIAIPAIGLVSWQRTTATVRASQAGAVYGVLAGLGFAVLFIALDRAGTRSGAWPLLPGQAVSVLLIAPFALHNLALSGKPSRAAGILTVGVGVLSGTANLLFLAATGRGQLAVVAVLTALYPTVTVVLARVFLAERWTRLQAIGLLAAATAVAMVSGG
jgi:drug/metabolite transporter (DMT)-like permease